VQLFGHPHIRADDPHLQQRRRLGERMIWLNEAAVDKLAAMRYVMWE
jgi:hypothetical protein